MEQTPNLARLLGAREGSRVSNHQHVARDWQQRVASVPWWVRRLECVRTLDGHRGCVNTIQWSAKGDFLISGSDDTKLKIWDMAKMKKATTVSPGHSANIFSAHFLPRTDEEQVVSCGADGNIIVTYIPSIGSDDRPRVRHLFTCHDNMVNKVVVDPSGPNIFYSCGDDGTVRRFDRRMPHECRGAGEACDENIFVDLTNGDKYTRHSVGLNALSINPSTGFHIAAAGSDPFIRLYDVRNPGKPYRTFRPSWQSEEARKARRTGPVLYMPYPHLTSLAFDHSGSELLASYGGDYIYLLQVLDGAESVTEVDMMDLERPSGQAHTTVSGEEQDAVTAPAPPSKHNKRKRTSTASEHTSREEDGSSEDSVDEETKSENEEDGNEEDDSENNAEEENEEDDDDDSDDDDWELEEEQIQSELEDDPRIRHPEVSVQFVRQWKGHLNVRTVKEVNFFGSRCQYVVSGSDDGNIFVWDKLTGELLIIVKGDSSIVNCVQGHPLGYPILAASGIDHNIKVFMPVAKSECDMAQASEIIEKNTRTLEHGRSMNQSALTEEMLLRLIAFAREDENDPDTSGSNRPNCTVS